MRFASDYFEQMAKTGGEAGAQGSAYVDFSSIEETRSMRGAVGEPGTPVGIATRAPKARSTSVRWRR